MIPQIRQYRFFYAAFGSLCRILEFYCLFSEITSRSNIVILQAKKLLTRLMSLYNIEYHQECVYYASEETSLFRQYRLSDCERIYGMNEERSVLVYVADGSLEVEWGTYSPVVLSRGTLFLVPKNLGFCCCASGACHLVASFFTGQLPLCNKYAFSDLQRDIANHTRQLPPPS